MDDLEKSIALYQTGLSTLKVRDITGITISRLASHLKKRGLTRSNKLNSRKYYVNHDFFEKIDTDRKAYWLGLLYADGYVSNRKTQRCVGLSLHESDKHLVEQLRDDLQSNYPVKTYTADTEYGPTVYSRLIMTSDKMFNDLVAHGMTEHKSLTLTFPNISDDLRHHFIRGYFDGDGSFSKSHDGYAVKICGTQEFLQTVNASFGFSERLLSKRHNTDTNTYALEICGRLQVIAIGDYMYKDSTIHLDRKHQRYLSLS